MDAVSVLKSAIGGAHMWYQGTTGDLTGDQLTAVPPGVAHPIGALMAHVVQCEDVMISNVIRGGTPLWEDGWKDKVGGALLVDIDPAVARAYRCDLALMQAYGQAVFASTEAFLDGLTEKDLERELDLMPLGFPSNMSVGAFLTQMLLGNTYAHTGEISSQKGLLGKKGRASGGRASAPPT
jgi:uncharacterized damage-inducible protein DinB